MVSVIEARSGARDRKQPCLSQQAVFQISAMKRRRGRSRREAKEQRVPLSPFSHESQGNLGAGGGRCRPPRGTTVCL